MESRLPEDDIADRIFAAVDRGQAPPETFEISSEALAALAIRNGARIERGASSYVTIYTAAGVARVCAR